MQPWQLDQQVCKQTIVTGAFLFEQLLDFLMCFIKPVLVFVSLSKGPQLQVWFPEVWSSSASTVLQALQLSHNEVFPPARLGGCFSPLGHEVCTLAVSLSGDLSSWEEV